MRKALNDADGTKFDMFHIAMKLEYSVVFLRYRIAVQMIRDTMIGA